MIIFDKFSLFLYEMDADTGSDADNDNDADTGSDNDKEDKTGGHTYDRETNTMNRADGSKDKWNNEKGGWDHYDKDGNFTGNDKDPKDGGSTGSGNAPGESGSSGDKEDHDKGSGGGNSGGSTGGSSSSSGGPSSGDSYGGTDLSSGSQTEGANQAQEKAKQDYDKAMSQLGADIVAAQSAKQEADKAQQAADKAKQNAAKAQQEAAAKQQAANEAYDRYQDTIQGFEEAKQKAKDIIAGVGGSNLTGNPDGTIDISDSAGTITGQVGPTGGTVTRTKTKPGIIGDLGKTTTTTSSTVSPDGTVETEVTVNGKPAAKATTVNGKTTIEVTSSTGQVNRFDVQPDGTLKPDPSNPDNVGGAQSAAKKYAKDILQNTAAAQAAQYVANAFDAKEKAKQDALNARQEAQAAKQNADKEAQNAAAAQQAANQAAQYAAAAQTSLGNSAAVAENAAATMDKTKEAAEAAAGKTSETLAGGEKEKEEALNKELDKILGGDETPPEGENPSSNPDGSPNPEGGNHSAMDKVNDNADKVTNQMQDILITGSFNDFVSQLITIDWLSGPDKESVLNQMDELAQYDNRTHEKVMDTLKDFVANIKQISASPTLTYFERIKAYITEIGDFFRECMSALRDSQFARALTLGFSLLRIAFTVMVMVALPQAAIPILGGFLVRWGWHAIKQGIKSDWKPEELGFRDGYDNAHQQWSKDFTIMGDEVFGDSEDPLSELHPNKYNVQQSHNYAGYNNGLKATYSDEDVKSYIIKVTRKSPIIRKWEIK